jgi:hypothetical protein
MPKKDARSRPEAEPQNGQVIDLDELIGDVKIPVTKSQLLYRFNKLLAQAGCYGARVVQAGSARERKNVGEFYHENIDENGHGIGTPYLDLEASARACGLLAPFEVLVDED